MRDGVSLSYGPGWVLLCAYGSLVSFLGALLAQSFLFPILFEGPLTAKTLWAGLLMPIPLWFLVHQGLLLVLRGVLWPIGVPGRFALDASGMTLRLGRETTTWPWSRIVEVRTREEALDLSGTTPGQAVGRLGVEAAAAVASAEWQLVFVAEDGATISVSSQGFRRPVRRAEPKIRRWLAAHLGQAVAPLADAQRYRV